MLISFRIDWFYLLDVQGILESLLQHHSLKASILQRSAFFMVQLSHQYLTTGKIIALTIQTLVGKMMFLLFNALSSLVVGEGDGTLLQYSCLENPMDGGAWWAAVHGVTKSRTRLSNFTSLSYDLNITQKLLPSSVALSLPSATSCDL